MARHNELGKWGEEQVVEKLLLDGYTIAERNWRMNHLEIDIVATRGDDIVFVEVKTRADRQTDPLEAMTPRKVALLCRAAEVYLRVNRVRLTPRFDVAAVSGNGHTCEMEYIPNAFLPPLKSY
ncbi:MAG: YraN family protein [Muribaculaceae bacterium]|nr:YraN family protein [Muribaculaceae bacterium]